MLEKQCDILVIGGGGSGLVAAAKAAETTGLKVLVLEKTKTVGGGMKFASTMRTFQSKWQAERKIPDQSNAFIRQMMDLTMWKLNPKLVKNAILGTGRYFDWYASFEDPEILGKYEARPYVFDIAVGGQPGPQIDGFHMGSGNYMMKAMVRHCEELGVEILTETAAAGAVLENGRLHGIRAQSPAGEILIACRSCIICSGSWISNKAIVRKVMPAFLDADVLPSAHQNPAYTGDGLAIAQDAGIPIDWKSCCLRIMGPICALGDRTDLDNLCHLKCSILVDMNAQRFVAEPMAPRMDPFDTGHVLIRHPRGRAFFLFSKNTLEHAIAETQKNGEKGDFDIFGIPALPPLETINGWFRQHLDRGSHELGLADTIEELAMQIGLDPDALKQTVAAYNESCQAGYDWSFFKDPADMISLNEGPYYAIAGKLSTDGAFGGIAVNERMQVIDENGTPVPGFYAAGDLASGRHIVMDGIKRQVLNDMSWALSSGFLAGEAAAEDLA